MVRLFFYGFIQLSTGYDTIQCITILFSYHHSGHMLFGTLNRFKMFNKLITSSI